jgi:hypothetical protein
MAIIEQLASNDVLDSAYEWLCRRRRDYSANSDAWALRRCWPREKERIKGEHLRRTSERGGTFWDYEKGICSAAR